MGGGYVQVGAGSSGGGSYGKLPVKKLNSNRSGIMAKSLNLPRKVLTHASSSMNIGGGGTSLTRPATMATVKSMLSSQLARSPSLSICNDPTLSMARSVHNSTTPPAAFPNNQTRVKYHSRGHHGVTQNSNNNHSGRNSGNKMSQ